MLKSQMAITGELLALDFVIFQFVSIRPSGHGIDRVPSIDYPLFIAAGFNRCKAQAS